MNGKKNGKRSTAKRRTPDLEQVLLRMADMG
jgi:hypothetical protein